jgi:hypothetical protein
MADPQACIGAVGIGIEACPLLQPDSFAGRVDQAEAGLIREQHKLMAEGTNCVTASRVPTMSTNVPAPTLSQRRARRSSRPRW